jgi:hypothetical protein
MSPTAKAGPTKKMKRYLTTLSNFVIVCAPLGRHLL